MSILILDKSEIQKINRLLPVIESNFEEPCTAQVYDYDNEIIEVEILSNRKRIKFLTVDRNTMKVKEVM